MNDQQRYTMIVRAIKRQQKAGVELAADFFGVYRKPIMKDDVYLGDTVLLVSRTHPEACAIGCLLAGRTLDKGIGDMWDAASKVLEQGNTDFANGLTDGFDGASLYKDLVSSRFRAGFRVGRKIRKYFNIK